MQLRQVHEWAGEAGAVALHYFNAVEARTKADHSVVTAADDEIERLLRDRIRLAYPDHGIVGEEQGSAPYDSEYLWALDPLDGTSSFVQGLPIWGISIGLLRHGIPVLGCFYMPLLNEWYEVDIEGPATFNGTPIAAATENLLHSESWICVPSNSHRRYAIDYPGKIRSLGSMAAYLCYVARGNAAGALVGYPKIWDLAAGLALLRRAGGDVRLLRSGGTVDVAAMLRGGALPEPIIAGSPAALAMLQKRIQRRP